MSRCPSSLTATIFGTEKALSDTLEELLLLSLTVAFLKKKFFKENTHVN